MRDLAEEVRAVGLTAGLTAVGMAPAAPMARARQALERRKQAGLHGGMHFTYGDPARSTDPSRHRCQPLRLHCLSIGLTPLRFRLPPWHDRWIARSRTPYPQPR